MRAKFDNQIDNQARLKRLRSATGVAYPTGYFFFRGAIYWLSQLFIKTKIYHDDRLPQPGGVKYRPPHYRRSGSSPIGTGRGYIIAANHGKVWDIPFIGIFRRGLVWVCKPQFCRNRFLAAVNQRMGAVPVFRPAFDGNSEKQHQTKIEALKRISFDSAELTEVAVKALSRGVPVLMFPEGSRVGSASVEEAKLGAARIALLSNCPIIPVAIVGCSKGDPDVKTRLLRRKVIIGLVGNPIQPDDYIQYSDERLIQKAMMEDWRRAINSLRQEGATKLIANKSLGS